MIQINYRSVLLSMSSAHSRLNTATSCGSLLQFEGERYRSARVTEQNNYHWTNVFNFFIYFFQFFYVSVLKIESYLLKNILYRPEFDHRGWLICECVYKHRHLIPNSGFIPPRDDVCRADGVSCRVITHRLYAWNKRLILRRVSDCLESGVANWYMNVCIYITFLKCAIIKVICTE